MSAVLAEQIKRDGIAKRYDVPCRWVAPEVEKPLTDTERLQMARQAWLRADRALKDMQRLHRYAKKTPAMKDDLARASGIYRHNTELHEKIMRGLL